MINDLFASAGLVPQGPVGWSVYLPNPGARVYILMSDGEVVYIGQDPHAAAQRLQDPYGLQDQGLWAYWASTDDPSGAEAKMLRWFSRKFNQLPRGN